MFDLPFNHNNPPLTEVLAERHAALAVRVEALAARANAAPRKIASDADLDAIGKLIVDTRKLSADANSTREAEKAPYLQGGRDVDAFFKVMTDRLANIARVFKGVADDHARAVAAEARAKAGREAAEALAEANRQAEIARRAEEAGRTKTADRHEAKAELAAEQAHIAQQAASAPAADLVRQRTASGVVSSARTEWTFTIENLASVPLDKIRPFIKPEHIEQAIRAFVRINKNSAPLEGVRIFEDVKSNFR